MKPIIFLILVTLLACSKQGENLEQNTEDIKSNTSIENVMPVLDRHNEQPVKTNKYKVGEPIELYDLINMFLPDEGETENQVSWKRIEEVKEIKWDKAWRSRDSKKGELSITINGEKYKNEWDLYLQGIDEGWSLFDISYSWNSSEEFEHWYYDDLENIFNHQTFTSKIIERNDDGLPPGWILYEIKFPGKKVFWMKVDTTGSGNKLYVFNVIGYLEKNDVNKY